MSWCVHARRNQARRGSEPSNIGTPPGLIEGREWLHGLDTYATDVSRCGSVRPPLDRHYAGVSFNSQLVWVPRALPGR
jgi:hypothetical protein